MTKYITPSDYLNYFGEDLELVLPDDDMGDSHKADRFIKRVEDDVAMFLAEKCFKQIDTEFPAMTEYQQSMYKLALLNQTKYKYDSGDVGNDSGYEPMQGKIADKRYLKSIVLSNKCESYLRLAGLYNRNVIASGGGWFNRFF